MKTNPDSLPLTPAVLLPYCRDCRDLAEWPERWMGEEKDLPPGRKLVEYFTRSGNRPPPRPGRSGRPPDPHPPDAPKRPPLLRRHRVLSRLAQNRSEEHTSEL